MCSSFESSASYSSPEELVCNEAVSNCQNRKWSSFLCMLAVSSVVSGNIISYYPDCGDAKLKLLFNCKIEPRKAIRSMPDINTLFCFEGAIKAGDAFKVNHYVPLIVQQIKSKRKLNQTASIQQKEVCLMNRTKVQTKLPFWASTLGEKLLLPKPYIKKESFPEPVCEPNVITDAAVSVKHKIKYS